VTILYCDNKHWITVSRGMGLGNENICIYDSMLKDSIENHLANQLEKMMIHTERDQPFIIAGKKKTSTKTYLVWAFCVSFCHSVVFQHRH